MESKPSAMPNTGVRPLSLLLAQLPLNLRPSPAGPDGDTCMHFSPDPESSYFTRFKDFLGLQRRGSDEPL